MPLRRRVIATLVVSVLFPGAPFLRIVVVIVIVSMIFGGAQCVMRPAAVVPDRTRATLVGNDSSPPTPADPASLEGMINSFRSTNGLSVLTRTPQMDSVASMNAQWNASTGKLTNRLANGQTIGGELLSLGLMPGTEGFVYSVHAQNYNPTGLFNAMKGSPAISSNMKLNWSRLGIGQSYNPAYGSFRTIIFY